MKGMTGSTLYEVVAQRVTRLIDSGAYRVGDRVPSVRALSTELKVSITTVLEAYRILENRGLIEPRPQSGYYVRPRPPQPADAPPPPRAPVEPTPVNVIDLSLRLVREGLDPRYVSLGVAYPNPDLLPSEKLSRLLAAASRRSPRMATALDVLPGCPALRVQIARRALLGGCTLSPDEFVTTCGAQEAISLTLRALCRPGDTVAVESPIFFGILQAIELQGLRAVEIDADPKEGMRMEALRAALRRHRVKLVVAIPSFNNPLGSCMPDEKRRELARMLASRDVPFLEDDMVGELHHGTTRPRMVKSYDTRGLVLACGSFSKVLAPGYRVGWLAPGRFQREIQRLKAMSTIATSTPVQMAIAEFLDHGGYDRYLRHVRRVYAANIHALARAVVRSFPTGTSVSWPAGGYVLWVRMPPGVDALLLYERALRAGATIAPGHIFSPRQRFRHFVRLNASTWSPEVDAAIATIGRIAGELARIPAARGTHRT